MSNYVFPVYKLNQDTPGSLLLPNAQELYPYVSAPEDGYAHWLFGGSNASLIPYGGSGVLSAQAGGQIWGANYVETPSYNNAVVSDVADSNTQTYMAVVQYAPQSGKNIVLLGNVTLAAEGSGIWINAAGQVQTILRNSTSEITVSHGIPAGVSAGDFMFVGLSKRIEGGVSKTRTIINNTVYEKTWGAAQTVTSGHKIAIGNPAVNTAIYTPAYSRTAELLIKPNLSVSASEMLEVYSHSKIRMADRGINLK